MVDNELAQNTYLVVDDDEFSREFIGGVLAHLGCNSISNS
jgi:hypothetical protein